MFQNQWTWEWNQNFWKSYKIAFWSIYLTWFWNQVQIIETSDSEVPFASFRLLCSVNWKTASHPVLDHSKDFGFDYTHEIHRTFLAIMDCCNKETSM